MGIAVPRNGHEFARKGTNLGRQMKSGTEKGWAMRTFTGTLAPTGIGAAGLWVVVNK